ncbi:hypothetical protein ASD15_28870 [Massilia sp. Root351]|uniref:YfiR family protein n=1 Tax=Massilia sp. Root351 TaxID=1736522 RepID=UPI00071041A2|nr:YfiR family protein [Massilia sp. Root351]KQV87249.1 hypothetical protein ASD15_28870 [Massilia sp. Root351]
MRAAFRISVLCTLASLAPVCHAELQEVQNSALKAAYIYNIAMFTNWPAGPSGAAADRPFAVCARSSLPFWDSLRQLEGKLVNGRNWTMYDTGAGAPPRSCDISIFAAELGQPRPADGSGTLFVADGVSAGKYAGAVALVDEDRHVRFDVDTREAARLGLKFSSRLLRLARNVW